MAETTDRYGAGVDGAGVRAEMIRVIVQQTDATASAHVGGPVETIYRTFDVPAPELSRFMRLPIGQFMSRTIVGVELMPVDDVSIAASLPTPTPEPSHD